MRRDAGDDDEPLGIVDRVHDPVVDDANAEVVSPGEPREARWSRIAGESVYRGSDPLAERSLEAPERTRGIRM